MELRFYLFMDRMRFVHYYATKIVYVINSDLLIFECIILIAILFEPPDEKPVSYSLSIVSCVTYVYNHSGFRVEELFYYRRYSIFYLRVMW